MNERAKQIKKEFEQCPVSACCDLRVPEEIMMSLDGGIALRTIIYRPAVDEQKQIPAVLMRTCYPGNDDEYRALAEEYAKRGMAFVYQYCRGTGGSEGVWEPYEHERADGAALLKWAEKQAWIETAGMLGSSYVAFTGWAVADLATPKIKTMYLSHYGTNRFISVYKDGLFRQDVFTAWTMDNAGFPITADYEQSCLFMPQENVDTALWGRKIDWYRSYINSPDEEAPYWQNGVWKTVREIPSHVKIPLCIVESWYDHHLGAAIDSWNRLPAESKRSSRFIIGGWDHSFAMRLGDRITPNARNNDSIRAFDWLYRILQKKQMPSGGVERYITAADRWVETDSLECSSSNMVLFLAKHMCETVTLSEQQPEEEGFVQFRYDPGYPKHSHGGESLMQTREEVGSLLQEPCVPRSDTVYFLSAPVKQTVICGKIKLHLTVATDADDTAFAFKIIEVFPDGRAYNIRTGITTLGYRNGSKTRQTYIPNQKVDIVIDSWDVAYELHEGSRIRVDVSSTDFPQYSVHSNYAGPWALQEKKRTATQTIYWGGENKSFLELPIQ